MEEQLLIASQSKRDRTMGQSNMLSNQSAMFSENLPKISGAQTKASLNGQNNTGADFNKQKSKSQGRNTANYNTASNFRNNN